MKKAFKILIISSLSIAGLGVILFCLLIWSMSRGNNPFYHGRHADLYTVAAFSVIGADSRGTIIKPIEKDVYGRVLFEISFSSTPFYPFYKYDPSHLRMFGYCVCQRTKANRAYYYLDDCFVVYWDADEFSETERIKLKQRNDWDAPLDESKMVFKPVIPAYESKKESTVFKSDMDSLTKVQSLAENIFQESVSNEENDSVYISLLDVDSEGKTLFIINVYHEKTYSAAYFVLVDSDGLHDIIPVADRAHYWEELKAFRRHNGWDGV